MEHLDRKVIDFVVLLVPEEIILVNDPNLQQIGRFKRQRLSKRGAFADSIESGFSEGEIREAAGFAPISNTDANLRFKHEAKDALLESLLQEIEQFLRSAWVKRTWTLQEYLLSVKEPVALLGWVSFSLPGLLKLWMSLATERHTMDLALQNTIQTLLSRTGRLEDLITASQ